MKEKHIQNEELVFNMIQGQIGYDFKNLDLLKQAFVRRSYSEENGGESNEVLEFIGDKVLVVTADNARQVEYGQSVYYFTEEKCEKLEADIAYARKNGYTILFFCHVGLSSLDKSFMANGRMYDLITSNADVINVLFESRWGSECCSPRSPGGLPHAPDP